MSDDKTDKTDNTSKTGTIEYTPKGVVIHAPAATSGAVARGPGQSAKTNVEEQPSHVLLRIIRHVNGLAVALESLRQKMEANERKGRT